MASRKLLNCNRNVFITCIWCLIGILSWTNFAEALVLPRDTSTKKGSQFIYNSVDLACPLPTKHHKPEACWDRCTHDNDCHGDKLCCSDGCQKLCTEPLLPPPVLDWEKAPTGHLVAANNWLVEGPAPPARGVPCSTSSPEPDITPLSCPDGTTCVIQDNGDPARGIPNRGICVEHREGNNNIPEIDLNTEDNPNSRCILDGTEWTEGEIFYRRCNMCACNRGIIICEVNDCYEDHFSGEEDW